MSPVLPPHSIDAEQATIGGVMLAPESLAKIAWLKADDFYRRDHQLIYTAVVEVAATGAPVDPVTMAEWFEAQGIAELVGGSRYVMELANTTPSAANIGAYADIVRDKSRLRQTLDVAQNVAVDVCAIGAPPQSILESAIRALSRIAGDDPVQPTVNVPMLARARFEAVYLLMLAKDLIGGHTLTKAELDRLRLSIERLSDMQAKLERARD